MIYWELFWTFAKIGAFTFGGGYAMLPMIQAEVVSKKHWATDDDILDYFAVGQCTPGVIAVNTASFVGYYRKGIPGCIAATLGVVFPSLVIILVIAALLSSFASIPLVQHALGGIRIAVAVLIVQAVYKMGKAGITNGFGWIVALAAFAIAGFTSVPTIVIVMLAAAAGVLWQLHITRKGVQS